MNYPNLFSKGTIGNITTKNKVVMTAMGVSLANQDGTPSDEIIKFYAERAKGGVGLIINEYTRVCDETGVAAVRQLSLTSDDKIPAFKKLTDAVHKYDTKIFAQLHHPGRETFNALNGFELLPTASVQACGLSLQATRSMSIDEIHEMQQKYVDAAIRANKAGYDGVELHGAHGYLIQQFLSPYTNHREDEYGGSTENRTRFVCEIISAIKKSIPNFPLSIRISGDEFLKLVGNPRQGIEIEESIKFAKIFEEVGIDIINVSAGLYETANTTIEPMSFPEGWKSGLVKAVKDNVSIPVFGVSVIRNPEFAEQLLVSNNQDFIGLGRPLLADPNWCNKALEGKENTIRKCISCLHCFETYLGDLFTGDPVQCAINPRTAYETKYPELKKDGKGRVVVVVGAGPSGLETAKNLALRDFKPIVLEKQKESGGQLLYAKVPPKKDKIQWFIDVQREELKELGIDIRYNVTPDVDYIKSLKPYALVIATGATPLVPSSIPGVSGKNVYTIPQILSGEVKLANQKIAVIGSGMSGLETAEFLSENNQVTIVEMATSIGPGAYAQNLMDVTLRLNENGAKYLPFHRLDSIEGNTVNLFNISGLRELSLDVDSVVLSLGILSNKSEELAKACDKVVYVGDSNELGRIAHAVRSGFDTAYNL